MSDVHDEYREAIEALPDDEVQKIASASSEDFRPEAVAFARQLLSRRGIEFTPSTPTPAQAAKDRRNPAKLIGVVVGVFVAAVGLNIMVRWYAGSRWFDPKIFITFIALAWWGIVYSERDTFRKRATVDSVTRIRVVGNVILAVFITFIAMVTCARRLPS